VKAKGLLVIVMGYTEWSKGVKKDIRSPKAWKTGVQKGRKFAGSPFNGGGEKTEKSSKQQRGEGEELRGEEIGGKKTFC